ncbi:MAG: hypothetical protein QMC06_03830, partial [Gammaproteobacteria bacterium]
MGIEQFPWASFSALRSILEPRPIIWLGPELLKAGDYTLYGFSLAPIFAFSLRSLYVLLCGFYPLPSPSWHLTH